MPKVEMSETAFIRRELEGIIYRGTKIEQVEYYEEKDNEFLVTIWFGKFGSSYDQFYLPESLKNYEIYNFEIKETYFGKVKVEILLGRKP